MASHADVRTVLLGRTGSGKSATGNTILGKGVFSVGKSMTSVTASCQEKQADVCGRIISVIDTPGLFDTTGTKENTTVTEEKLNSEMQECMELSAPGPHVFLLVIRLDVKFTEEEQNAVKWIEKTFGKDAVKYTFILFTHADVVKGTTLNEYVRQSNDLKALADKYGGRYHAFNNNNTESRDQVKELLDMITNMVRNYGGQCYTNEMYKEAQRNIQRENVKQRAIGVGKKSLLFLAGAAAVAVVGALIAGERGVEKITEAAAKGAARGVIEGAAAAVLVKAAGLHQ